MILSHKVDISLNIGKSILLRLKKHHYVFILHFRLLRDLGGRPVSGPHRTCAKYILWPGMLSNSNRLCTRMGEFVFSNGHYSIHLKLNCEAQGVGFLWSRFYYGGLQFYMVKPL